VSAITAAPVTQPFGLRRKMIILFFSKRFPKDWEPSHILYAAGVELLFDALLIGSLIRVAMSAWGWLA
jgi:hypothetical protein